MLYKLKSRNKSTKFLPINLIKFNLIYYAKVRFYQEFQKSD